MHCPSATQTNPPIATHWSGFQYRVRIVEDLDDPGLVGEICREMLRWLALFAHWGCCSLLVVVFRWPLDFFMEDVSINRPRD